ncbi:MAG: TonB-dependent receptor [Mucilaginibacter sp.]
MKFKTQVMLGAWPTLSRNLPIKKLIFPLLIIASTTNVMAKNGRSGILTNTFEVVSVQQQSIRVTGTISDNTGQTLVGATIKIKGTSSGAVSDINGKYSIAVPNANTTLVFTMVGYESQEITVGGSRSINVTLKETVSALNEVVVVGYGEAKKATLTGSISTVQGADVAKSPSPNLAASLEGRLPGLVVNQRTGEPGRDDPNIFIRGTGTDGNSSPLVIIDGVPRDGFSRLNPEDIASFSVLKDASAAIYGARAANGVILITTKRGAKGKPVFNFSYNYGIQSPTKLPTVLDGVGYATAYNEGDFYDQRRPTDPTQYHPTFSPDQLAKLQNGTDPSLPNTNWVKQAIKPSVAQKKYNMQLTGGSDDIHYLMSFGSQSQEGFFINNPTNYQQYNFRVKVDADVTKYLNIGANISGNLSNSIYPSNGAGSTAVNFVNILQANPTLVARYPNGLLGGGRLGQNPLLMNERGTDQTNSYPLFSTFTASLKIPGIEGLKLDASYNYDLSNGFESNFDLPYTYYQYNGTTQNYDLTSATGPTTVSLNDTYRRSYTILYNYRLSYDHNFGKHHVGGMVGHEEQQNYYQQISAYRKNFLSPAIPQLDLGSSAATDKDNGGFGTSSAYNNYFGRFNYDYDSKYLLEAVFRYDGSQIFAPGHRYSLFPGISAGWRLSEEKFIKDNDNLKFIDQLKLRASWGEVGNDRVNAYQYLQQFGFGNNYVFGTSDAGAIYAKTVPNPDITWETSKKTDVGLESDFWNGLLGFDFTYWNESRTNLLEKPSGSTSGAFGFTDLPNKNIGKVSNHGFEVVINHRSSIGQVKYSLSASLSYNRSKVIFADEAPQLQPYQGRAGHPVGAGSYYKADGIYHTQAELDASPHAAGSQVGDIKVLDLNGDGKIDGNDAFTFDGSQIPRYVFGLNSDFAYKGFDLNIFIQGQAAAWAYDGNLQNLGTTDFANSIVARWANHWTPSNPTGTMPRARAYQYGNTTFFLYNDSFARLKTLELGYTIPGSVLSKLKVRSLRVYVSAYNLLTYSPTIKWADPELSFNGSNNTGSGSGTNSYPPMKVINFGATLTF